MTEILPYLFGALVALVTGILVYIATRKRDKVDDRSKLFDDALQLAEAHKEAWAKATEEVECLRTELGLLKDEIEDLRTSVKVGIREGEMWRGVAVDAFAAHVAAAGSAPLWWPKNEPCPAATS